MADFPNREGIEVGGPSFVFKVSLPVYRYVRALDGVNLALHTKWEGSIEEGSSYRWFPGKLGTQYISECTDLGLIKSGLYDFVISSNCLEHSSNPLKALKEWSRVTRKNGYILLVLPRKENNCDHMRLVTTFEHIYDDYINDIDEDDLINLEEVLELHDLARDLNAGGYASFEEACRNNFVTREMHHRVFDKRLVDKMFEYCGIEMIYHDFNESDNFFLGKSS